MVTALDCRYMASRVKRPENIAFGRKLRLIREERGLSQGQIGAWFSLTNKAISQYEAGGTEFPSRFLPELARKLKVPVGYFYDVEDDIVTRNQVDSEWMGYMGRRLAMLPPGRVRDTESYLIVQKGKGNKRREVPLSDDLVTWLRDWLRVREATSQQFFVHGPSHRPISKYLLRAILAEVKAAAGIRDKQMTPHSLRHSFATTLYDETKDMAMVQEILGHKHIETTRGYVHVDDKRKFAAVQKLNQKPVVSAEQKKPIKPIRMLKRMK